MPAQAPPEELQTPTLTQFVQLAIENRLGDVHTCSYGTVTSYDATRQEATVQIIPRRQVTNDDGDATLERPAPLLNAPVIFPGSGDWSLTFPVKAGDTVLVVFLECATDAFLAGGGTDVDTGDYTRKHHMSDAVCYPGFRSSNKRIAGPPPSDAMVLTGSKIQLGSKDASQAPALNADLVTLIGAIKSGGSDVPGAVTAAFPTNPSGASKVAVE